MDLSTNAHTILPPNIQSNVPLADKTWFRVGGPARWYAEPRTEDELAAAILFAQSEKVPLVFIGEGANILISDHGFDGLVIRPQLNTLSHFIEHGSGFVTAGAGTSFSTLIEYCLNNGLAGLEEFSGIPGSVGGSVYINIHYFEYLLSQFLVSARIIERTTGRVRTVSPDWFEFGYNQSRLQRHEEYLVDATFKLTVQDPLTVAYAQGRRFEMMRYRARRYPTSGTCGSFFRNFTKEEISCLGASAVPYVAYYLDRIGVKGSLAVGKARVSHQHANMLVNTGGATAAEIAELARIMQEKVFATFGIVPQPECLIIGFADQYPLLR